jgi:septal ring factor EnvC (AmiA/AmiB activator)
VGQLGTTSSSRRYKKEIKPMDSASEGILALKPVTFHYKSDATGTPQFGLIAEEVAEVNPDLVVRDENGEIYTVRYDAVNAMLLNEFLKEHRKVEKQQSTIETQEATVTQLKSAVEKQEAIAAQQQKGLESRLAQQEKQIAALASDLQKVSARVEMNKPDAQMAVNLAKGRQPNSGSFAGE